MHPTHVFWPSQDYQTTVSFFPRVESVYSLEKTCWIQRYTYMYYCSLHSRYSDIRIGSNLCGCRSSLPLCRIKALSGLLSSPKGRKWLLWEIGTHLIDFPQFYKGEIFWRSGPEVIKIFSCSTQLSMKFVLLINLKLFVIPFFFSCLTKLSMKFSLLINMKMPTIVGIFIFISKENFMLSWVEHETSGLFALPHVPSEKVSTRTHKRTKSFEEEHFFFV